MSPEAPTDLVAELVDRLAVADRFGAIARAHELLAEGLSRDELLEVVRAAQREVGRLWQVNAWSVAQEHAATAVSEAVVQAIGLMQAPAEERGHVAVVCADGEWHVLPARLLAETLAGAGYRVTFVGGSVPPEHLHRYLPELGADAVAVSCTLALNLAGAARTIAAVHAHRLRAVVGGAAFGPDGARATAVGADAWAPTPAKAVEVLDAWREEGGGAPTGPAPRLARGEHEVLLRDEQALADDAYRRLEARFPPMAGYSPWQRDRTREDLAYHLRYLASALLVGDDRVYLEMIPWLTDLLVSRGVGPDAVTVTLDVLEDVLSEHGHTGALHIVRRARDFVPSS